MSEEKNIDKLFQSKLKGREVAYSEGAWAGASKMLDGHFRWLFFRRALYLLIPIVAISGGALWVMLGQDIEYSTPKLVTENNTLRGSFAAASSAFKLSSQSSRPNDFIKAESIESVAAAMTEEERINVKNESASGIETDHVALIKVTGLNLLTALHEGEVAETKTGSAQMPVAARASLSSLEFEQDINPHKYLSISSELATIKLDNKLDLMPRRTLDSEYEHQLANYAHENPMLQELQKSQLYVEGGLLAAKAMGTDKSIGFGAHARLLLRYHLGESVYLDFGMGVFNRNALPEGNTFALGGTDAGWVQVNPITINYASIYLGTGYRIGARHSLGLGFEVDPMLAVVANKQKNYQSEFKQENNIVIDKSGIADMDAALVANYRFSFAERWDATSELHLGFIKVTDNNLFANARNSDRNTLLKLGVAYRLTNR